MKKREIKESASIFHTIILRKHLLARYVGKSLKKGSHIQNAIKVDPNQHSNLVFSKMTPSFKRHS